MTEWRCYRPDCPDKLNSDGCGALCAEWPGRKCPGNPRRKANWEREGADHARLNSTSQNSKPSQPEGNTGLQSEGL